MGLPAKIKLSSSGSLLAGFFPSVAHLSQLEAKCFKLLLNFVAKFLYFLFPPARLTHTHTPAVANLSCVLCQSLQEEENREIFYVSLKA